VITTEKWSSGSAYERYMGRWSRAVAAGFVTWLNLPSGLRWLDIGCGTGALTATILARAEPANVLGSDPSEEFVAAAGYHLGDPRAQFVVGDAIALPPGGADVIVSGLVINFLSDPSETLQAWRSTAAQGTVAAYVWDYAEGMQMLRYFWDAAVALDSTATALDEARRFPVCQPNRLEDLWRRAGFADVTSAPITITTDFADFGDYWEPFLGGQGPAPGYVASLTEPARVALREGLRAVLPVAPEGTITLTARAWAVRGSAPSSPPSMRSPNPS
jgi:SAM-dependent methyltransferase